MLKYYITYEKCKKFEPILILICQDFTHLWFFIHIPTYFTYLIVFGLFLIFIFFLLPLSKFEIYIIFLRSQNKSHYDL